jgi:hypothetical protein
MDFIHPARIKSHRTTDEILRLKKWGQQDTGRSRRWALSEGPRDAERWTEAAAYAM